MMRTAIVRNQSTGVDLGAMARDLVQPYVRAYDSWRSGVTSLLERQDTKDARCSSCAQDDCSCSCCVADSDLLVETRLGERRVIPITIENHWRREREIELELSSWTRTDGVEILSRIMTPINFTIEPCGEAKVTLAIEIGPVADAVTDNQKRAAASKARKVTDVTECTVGYADLRVKGCDIRPIRIAVAVLPHHCDDFVVDCRCGCC